MVRTHGNTHFTPDTCFGCKLVTIQFDKPTFTPHYNYSVGQYVTSKADFEDKLKQCAAQNSELLGIEHDYQPRYPGDTKPLNDGEGLEDHFKARAGELPKEPALA